MWGWLLCEIAVSLRYLLSVMCRCDQEVMGKIDPDIPLLCVCGNHDVGNVPNKVTIDRYTSEFGDDYFAFWVGGVRGLVLNSNLLFDPSEVSGSGTSNSHSNPPVWTYSPSISSLLSSRLGDEISVVWLLLLWW